jgi:putative transposase
MDSKVQASEGIINQKEKGLRIYRRRDILIKVGPEYIWLWVTIEPENREILALSISKERNMFVAERFLDGLIKIHGKHCVSTDGGTWYPPQACAFLKIDHHIHSPLSRKALSRELCNT